MRSGSHLGESARSSQRGEPSAVGVAKEIRFLRREVGGAASLGEPAASAGLGAQCGVESPQSGSEISGGGGGGGGGGLT